MFRFNLASFHRWLIRGLTIGLVMLAWTSWARANGGTTLLIQKVGPYELLVSASPYPLAVSVNNDISILLGRQADAQVVLDAEVTLIAEPLDQPGPSQSFPATHDHAVNKLYYAANVVFPTPGRWKLTVQVNGPEGSASTTFETQVVEGQAWSYLHYLIVGFPVIIVLIFFILRRGSEKVVSSDGEGEEG